eukprot:2309395-Amphidinium_carterae.1
MAELSRTHANVYVCTYRKAILPGSSAPPFSCRLRAVLSYNSLRILHLLPKGNSCCSLALSPHRSDLEDMMCLTLQMIRASAVFVIPLRTWKPHIS